MPMTHLDFAVGGIYALTRNYEQTFDMTPGDLAVSVATTVAQPFRCVDCEVYFPLVTILGGYGCSVGRHGHRASNEAIQSILDTRENHLREHYPVKAGA